MPEPTSCERFLDAVPFNARGHAPARGAGRRRCRTRSPTPKQAGDVDAAGLRPDPQRARPLERAARRPHRHDLARRHRLDQSRRLGEPARPLRARGDGRHLQGASASPRPITWEFSPKGQHIELGIAEMNLFILLVGARPVAFAVRRAAAADRHALRPVHRARPRCAELRLLPGRPLHPRRDALGRDAGAGGRRAPVDRHAADRHGAGRPRRLRAGLRRRARGRSCAGPSTICSASGDGRAPRRADAGCATRPAARSICASRPAPLEQPQRDDDAGARRATSSTAPTGCASPGPNAAGRRRLYGRGRAGGDRGGRADGRGPARRRPARRHLGRPAQRRLDGGAAGPRARPRPRRAATSSGCSRDAAAALRRSSRCSTAIRRRSAWLGAVSGHRTRSLGVEHFGQTGTIARPLPPLRHRRAGHHRGGRDDRAGAADPPSEGARLTASSGRAITPP